MTSRKNRVRNPQLGDNGDYYSSSVDAGTVTTAIADLAGTGQPLPSLRYVWRTTVATTAPTRIDNVYSGGTAGNYELPVSPGDHVTASGYIRVFSAAAGLTLLAYVQFYNASNAQVGASVGGTGTGSVATTSGTWQRPYVVNAVAPSGAVRARLLFRATTTASFAVGNRTELTGILVEVSSTASVPLGAYFSPAVTPGSYWDGPAEASTSTLYAFVSPVVTFQADPPSAHIVYQASDLADDTGTITLYEIHDGQTRSVRTAIDAFAVGGIAIDDTEIPRGTDVAYRAEVFRTDGTSVGFTPTTTVNIPGEVGIGYLSNPLDPATPAIRVEFRETVGSMPKTDAPGATYRAGLRTVALLAPRGLLRDVDLSFYTDTLTQYDAVKQMVADSNGLLLMRVDPPIGLPRLVYFWAKGITWDEFSRPAGLEDYEWDNIADQISPIDGEPLTSTIPWQLYIDAFPLWSDMNAAYLSWLDAINNPPEA